MNSRKPDRRSDKIRQRLDQESKTWINQASSRLTAPENSSKSINDSHRSLDPSINPHAKKQNRLFHIGWRTISFLLVGFFSFSIFTAWESPQYRVRNISIAGLQRLDQNDVLQNLDIAGKQIFALDIKDIEQQLQRAYPELWDIKIYLSIPDQVSIKLIERQPMIEWTARDQKLWIDAEGFLIPARTGNMELLSIKADSLPPYQISDSRSDEATEESAGMRNIIKDKPQINGEFKENLFFAFPKQINANLLTAILQLNAWMPDEQELLYEAIRGVGWKDHRGWNVFIGSKLENINDKMLMYEMIVRQLDKQGIAPSMVSVEFLHAPYYRLEE